MYLQSCLYFLLVLQLSFTVMSTLEVINDMTSEEADDFLVREELLPFDALSRESVKKNKRTLTSVGQTENSGRSSDSTLKAPAPKSTDAASTQSSVKSSQHSSTNIVNNDTSGKTVVAGGKPETRRSIVDDAAPESAKGEDDIDLVGEGYLLVSEKVQSPTRKLSEFHREETSEDNDLRESQDVSPIENLNPENVQELDGVPDESLTVESAETSKEARANEGPVREEDLGSEDVQEPVVDDTNKVLDIACIDKSSWECLMFKEDYLAMKKDWNLSEKTMEKIRVKRQGNGNNAASTRAPTTTKKSQATTTPPEEGSGQELYPQKETKKINITLKSNSTFKTNLTPTTLDEKKKNEIIANLIRELERVFGAVRGFMKVNVKNVSFDQNGNLKADWDLIINSGFLSGNSSELLDQLRGDIEAVNGTYKTINIPDLVLEGDLDTDKINEILEQAKNELKNDPCGTNPCTPGYSGCKFDKDTFEITCTSNCYSFGDVCQHGGECELNATFDAYCSCTKNWEGEHCEKKKSSDKLDAGQITGVVLGAIAAAAGALGFCFWMLACRKSNKDIAFSHYSDEEGSGKFSNPSSKLSAFVIDRPKISVNPIQVFRPTPPSSAGSPPNSGAGSRASFARRSSIGSLDSEPQRAPKGKSKYPYSKA